jgi:hypothetical protein
MRRETPRLRGDFRRNFVHFGSILRLDFTDCCSQKLSSFPHELDRIRRARKSSSHFLSTWIRKTSKHAERSFTKVRKGGSASRRLPDCRRIPKLTFPCDQAVDIVGEDNYSSEVDFFFIRNAAVYSYHWFVPVSRDPPAQIAQGDRPAIPAHVPSNYEVLECSL